MVSHREKFYTVAERDCFFDRGEIYLEDYFLHGEILYKAYFPRGKSNSVHVLLVKDQCRARGRRRRRSRRQSVYPTGSQNFI